MKRLLLIMALTLPAIATQAQQFTQKNVDGKTIAYSVLSDSTVSVVRGCKGFDAAKEYTDTVVIPLEVEYLGKRYTVTAIGEGAFSNCKKLRDVAIPEAMTTIGKNAFRGCKGLARVFLPASVANLHTSALPKHTEIIHDFNEFSAENEGKVIHYLIKDDNTLEVTMAEDYAGYITIPEHVTYQNEIFTVSSIGTCAFAICENPVIAITIPKTVTTIADEAFLECRKLGGIYVAFPDGLCLKDQIERQLEIVDTHILDNENKILFLTVYPPEKTY